MELTAYYTDRARSASLQTNLPCKVTKSNVRNSLIAARSCSLQCSVTTEDVTKQRNGDRQLTQDNYL